MATEWSWPKQPKESEHTVHMWTPFHLRVDKGYRFFPKGPLFKLIQTALRGLILFLGPPIFWLVWGLRVHGKKNIRKTGGGAVTVCNHVHYLDCVMLACNCHSRMMYFLSLKSNFEIPVVRHLIRLLGAVPLPDTGSGMAALNRSVGTALKNGAFLQIYPEGILYPYYREKTRPFHKGAFYYACHHDMPVLPYVLTFRSRTGWRSFWGTKPLMDLYILEPIYQNKELPKKEAEKELCMRVQASMDACIAQTKGEI